MGDIKNISVLIPARDDHNLLLEGVNNILSTANNPDEIEILIKMDSDDASTALAIPHLPANCKTIIYPRGRGYGDLHIFYNDLGRLSIGKWLIPLAADSRMETMNWDTEILSIDANRPVVIWPNLSQPEYNKHFPYVSPIVSRRIFEHWGHFGLAPQIDSWLEIVSNNGGLIKLPSITVGHTRSSGDGWSQEEWASFAPQREVDTIKYKQLLNG